MTSGNQQTERVTAGGLQVASTLYDFVSGTVLPRIGVQGADQDKFWEGFGALVAKHTPATVSCSPSVMSCRPSWMPGTPRTRASRTRRSTPPS